LPANAQAQQAFLRHLVHEGEILGAQISSINNLSLYLWLVKEAARKLPKERLCLEKEMVVKLMQRL